MRARTGSAILRDGRWYARITLHREPLRGGRRPRHEQLVTRDDGRPVTESHARTYATRLQGRYDAGTWQPERATALVTPAPTLTVRSWVTTWLDRQTYREVEKDRGRLTVYLDGTAFAALALRAVTPRDVAAWLDVIRAKTTTRGKTPAPRTVRNALDPVARALRAAVFAGHLTTDPCAVLPPEVRPKSVDRDPTKRRGMRLTRTEAETLLGDDGTPDDRLVLYHLLLLSGARLGEAVALRWCDVSPDAPLDRIVIAEQWHQRLKARTTTKTTALREVPCHPLLARVLAWWRASWPRWYGRAAESTDLVVPARAHRSRASVGGVRRQASVWRELQSDLGACGLTSHRVHDLRHTFVSLCADAGMAGDVVSRWTHTPGGASARHLYLVPSWPRQCEEMRRLVLTPRDLTLGVGESVGEPRSTG